MSLKINLKKAAACIKRNKRFLITTHTNPEGDALGAELAFYRLLNKLGKEASIINEDSIPAGYEFLPLTEKIKKYKQNIRGIKFDCFVALDCSDLQRTGEVYRMNRQNQCILNIDHHISNNNFGRVNWVDAGASCTCEMIYRLYKAMGVALDKDAALCLYVGILTDTGSFRYSNTTAFTHRAAAELLEYGLDVVGIYREIYENIPFSDMQLLVRVLPGIKREAGGKIVWAKIPRNLLRNKKLSFDLSEHILTHCRYIKDMEVAVLFKENLGAPDEIRINFRSQGKVDVNKIAKFFGGGGHKTASGATVRGNIDAVRKKVLAKIKESIKQGLFPQKVGHQTIR